MAAEAHQTPEMYLVPDPVPDEPQVIDGSEPVSEFNKTLDDCYRDHPSQAARAMGLKQLTPRKAG